MRSKCRFDVQNPDLGMSLFIATKRLFLSPIHSNLASKVGPVKVQFDYICMYLKCQTVNKYILSCLVCQKFWRCESNKV